MNLFQELSGHKVVLKSLAQAQIIRPMPEDDLILCPSCGEEKDPSQFLYRQGHNDPRKGQLATPKCRVCYASQRVRA